MVCPRIYNHMSSRNLLADRRMEFARCLHARGDTAAAIELLEQALDLAPDWAGGHFLLGEWLADAGRRAEAIAAYRRCLKLDSSDRLGAVLRLALIGAIAVPPAMPPAYVAGVFDGYADHFDSALIERLHYTVPADLRELVDQVTCTGQGFGRLLDLGCGTGLAGERFRAVCAWLEGVDLSEGMTAQARRKAIYDELAICDAVPFLAANEGRYDLIVAADVLVYFGDLTPVITGAMQALAPDGRLALSVEAADSGGYRLTAGQRYAHSEAYLRQELGRTGFLVEAIRETVCRTEAGQPLKAYLAVARKPATVAPDGKSVPAPEPPIAQLRA